MPLTDSRLGPGTLKLGAPLVDYGPQIANVMLEPSQDEEDGTPTLADPDPLPEISESWVLSGEAIQDFTDPAGFINYCMDNALEIVAFEWVPDTADGVKFTGNVRITSLPIGGDVAKQNLSSFEFPVQGTPVRTDPVAAPAGSSARKRRAGKARAKDTGAKPVEVTT